MFFFIMDVPSLISYEDIVVSHHASDENTVTMLNNIMMAPKSSKGNKESTLCGTHFLVYFYLELFTQVFS